MNFSERRQLMEQGFCLFPRVLPDDLRARLVAATEQLTSQATKAQQERFPSQGSMFPTNSHPVFGELITFAPALAALVALGFEQPTFSDGYIISKPGHSPRLFWHYDWFAWEDPRSYTLPAPQIFLMYYLSDTHPENGCLRVIPGSHIHHNPLHDLLKEPHSAALAEMYETDLPEFAVRPDEIDVPIRAGDLLVGDARLLHATHSNDTDERRTVITLWFQPDLRGLPEPMQAQIAAKTQTVPEDWPDEIQKRLRALISTYSGSAVPYKRTLYRPCPDRKMHLTSDAVYD